MAKLDVYLEAERRGILPPDKAAILIEARRRGLVKGGKTEFPKGYISENPTAGEYARTAFDQGMQGATFGFADEISDRIGAALASGVTGEPYKDLLAEARSTTKNRLNEQFREMPVTSIAANMTGGVVSAPVIGAAGGLVSNVASKLPLAGAVSRAGNTAKTAIESVRGGKTALQAGKGAVVGAGYGAAYGAGTAETGQRAEGAKSGAKVGAIAGAAVPVIAKGASQLNTALGKKSPVLNADQIRQKASQLYKVAEQKGGTLKPEFTNQFVDEVEKLKPQTDIGKLVGGDTPFTQTVEKIASIRDRPMTLDAAQELDELIGDAIDGFMDSGRLTKQGKKLLDIQSTLRNAIDEAGDDMIIGGKEGFESLKEARKLWSTSRRLADIERIIQRAELMDNPATGIKTGFRTLLNNPARLRGYSKTEQSAIKRAAESGIASDLLRTFGSRLVPIAATVKGGPLGAAASYAGAAISREAAGRVQVGKAKNLAEMIANQGKPVQKTPLISFDKRPKISGGRK